MNKPKKKRAKATKTSFEAPPTASPTKASSSALTNKKMGLIDEDDDDVSTFFTFEGPNDEFDKAFVPN